MDTIGAWMNALKWSIFCMYMNIDPYNQVIWKTCEPTVYIVQWVYNQSLPSIKLTTVVNFKQLYPIQQNPKFQEEQDWQMNQHAYPDVKILNTNDREHVGNMHIEQPMNHFRSNEAIHQNPQIPNMNPNFSFFTNHVFFAIKGVKTCVQHPYKKPITYFTSKHPHPWKSPNSILTHEP